MGKKGNKRNKKQENYFERQRGNQRNGFQGIKINEYTEEKYPSKPKTSNKKPNGSLLNAKSKSSSTGNKKRKGSKKTTFTFSPGINKELMKQFYHS